MEKNYYSLLIFLLLFAFTSVNAQDAPVVTFNIPYQNNLKYNRFLQNPAFSFVREDNTYISLYHRNQWVQFDDSPKVYMASYSGKFSERSGLGIGLYQQNLGIIVSFGGIANFSYNVKIAEKINLTLGFNLAYYNSGIDRNRSVTEEPDPALLSMQNNSLLSINPGFNVSYGKFDFGVYAENLIDYDFKSSKMAKEYSEKSYTAHLMYSQPIRFKNLLEGTNVRLAMRAKKNENDLNLKGSMLFDFPKIGWLQAGMDDFYGLGAGIGFYFTKRLSLGYTYEKGIKDGLSNLGATHEITIAFSFKDKAELPVKILEENASDTLLGNTIKKPDFDRDLEIEKLRNLLDETHMHLLDLLAKEDSLSVIRKAEFDEKVKNLMEYAKRENAAKEERIQQEKIEKVKEIITEEQAKKEAESKIDQEIKALYSKGAKSPKQSPKKGNKFSFENVEPGHYIIANVFSDEINAEKFIDKMKAKGIDAGYIDNPINGFRYVYLSKHILWKDALISYYSNVGNSYYDTVWIMSINTN